ncbi:nucleotidyltransferase family protein [Serratia fonticola]|uniref:nucleotidyltransferase family protein n=1 Tax=Serratia fonticola TaxID=47917 RepID=UPI0034C65333
MISNWHQIKLSVNSTVLDALEILNKYALRIVLIVNEHEKLLGVVTDGDIRRGLVRGIGIQSTVDKIMTVNPYYFSPTIDRVSRKKILAEKNILAAPLIHNGKVVGVETIHEGSIVPSYDNPVFIMAGGFGTRLRPLTNSCPKPMLQIGGRPMLEIIIDQFIKFGFSNFYISTHFMPEVIRDYFGNGSKWNVNIEYVHEENPLGTGGALGLLPEGISELPLIMVNGDVLTTINFERLLNFHTENNAAATMCVRDYQYTIPYGVIESDGSKIISMEEKPTKKFFVNAGIYIVDSSVRMAVKKNQHIDMPTLLEQKMNAGNDVLIFPIHEYWLDIGRMDDFNRAQEDIKILDL